MDAETLSAWAAGAAVLLSIGSFAYTNSVSSNLRKYQFRLDQWSTLRQDIYSRLERFEDIAAEMLNIDIDEKNIEKAKLEFRNLHRRLNGAHIILMQGLKNASKTSALAATIDWVEAGFSPRLDGDTNVDRIGNIANDVHLSDERLDILRLLKSILEIALATGNEVRSSIRQQNNLFDPNFHAAP